MEMMIQVIFALDIIGTIAFAISGALVGIEKKMDIFGVAILGVTTAVGGGVLRDIILNIAPPAAFRTPVYAVTAIVVSAIMFSSRVRKIMDFEQKAYENILFLMDTIGLAVFTLTGAQTAIYSSYGDNAFLAVFVGALTGVGGGLLRDIFAGETPYIFRKHFYACSSIIGAIAYVYLIPMIGGYKSMLAGGVLIIVLRILAAIYRWSLPQAK